MKKRYGLLRREWGTYYVDNQLSGQPNSLKTKDREHAGRLGDAMNEAEREVGIRKQIGILYLSAADPNAAKRTWCDVMNTALQLSPPKSKSRWETAVKDKAFNAIRHLPLVQTGSDDFLKVLAAGTVSTNVYLRRLQNLAVELRWIGQTILPRKLFPKPQFSKKRAITFEEHQRIIHREANPERRLYYNVIWHTGAAQSDIAHLQASCIDWDQRVLTYIRMKTGQVAQVRIGDEFAVILRQLPTQGALFPHLITVKEKDRATEFAQRCKRLGIHGVTLHSYRYSWAQRAKAAGYPQRYAQHALGHACKAVTEAYAADAQFVLPSLEDYQREKDSRREAFGSKSKADIQQNFGLLRGGINLN